MPEAVKRSHPPLVVIANSQEWLTRSLESILGPQGYAVLRAYTGKQAIERVLSSHPDVIVIDTDLPDMDGLQIIRTLRGDPRVSASTPILATSPGHQSRETRLAALRAGAWDFLGTAIDSEELSLRLDTYVRAKFDADQAREDGLLDHVTGLYNVRGLARRARELGSAAFRNEEPLACLVLAPIAPAESAAEEAAQKAALTDAVEHLGRTLRDTGRICDAIGRLGPTEFAVVLQGTDAVGVRKMAERLNRALEALQVKNAVGLRLRMAAGYDAVANYHESPIDPSDMLARATMAMRRSRSDTTGDWINAFEQAPPRVN